MDKKKKETLELTGGGELPVYAYRDGASAALERAAESLDRWAAAAPPAAPKDRSGKIEKAAEDLGSSAFGFKESELAKRSEDAYRAGAERAAADAMAKSAALTGGYSNSWAQSAADSAYNKYMSAYGEKILPALYKTALSQYETESQNKRDAAKLLSQLDSEEFDRYGELLKLYFSEGDSLRDFFSDVYKTDSGEMLARLKLLSSL